MGRFASMVLGDEHPVLKYIMTTQVCGTRTWRWGIGWQVRVEQLAWRARLEVRYIARRYRSVRQSERPTRRRCWREGRRSRVWTTPSTRGDRRTPATSTSYRRVLDDIGQSAARNWRRVAESCPAGGWLFSVYT